MSNFTKLQKQIEGQIADASGHTDFRGSLDEAVALIMENVQKNGKWAYVNGTPFVFEHFDQFEQDKLRNALDSVENPHFVLTGKLQGGAAELAKLVFALMQALKSRN